MSDDRRDGVDRRGAEDPITIGEVYRLCQRIEERMSSMSDGNDRDIHSLRTKIDANNVTIELLKAKVATLESHGRDWRGWIASGIIGGGLAIVPFILQWLSHHP